ncbi:quinolinate phosphoribosyltransferase [decarboxylating] 1a [Humulus lupulus]|uniref:quinolinate phosphoribosyltransferase [decarboxylating] 1a n=1 Tax=Humulus lupulus TaxID=3486 RepID=UPI002B4123E0|nr:quinolinate phosphoribosyltransferase [decarboxylating] 1a [Humulus lupulus]
MKESSKRKKRQKALNKRQRPIFLTNYRMLRRKRRASTIYGVVEPFKDTDSTLSFCLIVRKIRIRFWFIQFPMILQWQPSQPHPQLSQYSHKVARACRRPIGLLTSLSVQRRSDRMHATANPGVSIKSMVIEPPSHPTYDLNGVIKLALAEDAGDLGDVTTLATVPSDVEVEAHFLAKEDGVIAGIALAEMVFQEVDPSLKVEWSQKDGDHVHKGLKIGRVYGTAYSIVVAERVALNFMQRMSGIATLTKAMADAAHPALILETRKTAPGLRLVDKWAVLIGGGRNHRMGLFDMVLIKDNHISAAGSVTSAVKSVDTYLEQKNIKMEVEVETRTLEEVQEVLHYASQSKTSLTRIMLDNMVVPLPNGDVDVSMLKEAVKLINGKFETEASGNVTFETVHKIGSTGVTYISSGALTHSVKALDISLKIDTELALQVGRRTKRA